MPFIFVTSAHNKIFRIPFSSSFQLLIFPFSSRPSRLPTHIPPSSAFSPPPLPLPLFPFPVFRTDTTHTFKGRRRESRFRPAAAAAAGKASSAIPLSIGWAENRFQLCKLKSLGKRGVDPPPSPPCRRRRGCESIFTTAWNTKGDFPVFRISGPSPSFSQRRGRS